MSKRKPSILLVTLGLSLALLVWLLSGTAKLASAIEQGLDTRASRISLARNTERADGPENEDRRLREGTKITNRLGRFQHSSSGATFVTEDDLVLGGLPNLNLERVVKMLKSIEQPDKVWWRVSGTITEFSGRNYLLIERAVYKSATAPAPIGARSAGDADEIPQKGTAEP